MAKVVEALGTGGQRQAERELGWNRGTIRKGQGELENGPISDNLSARGRKKAEDHLPNLLEDIQAIVEPTSQADPTFRTTQLYTPLTAEEVRRRLVDDKGYADEELPTRRTISTKLNGLDFHPQKVAKSKPSKKIPETDAIFEHLHQVNQESDAQEGVLRISMDAKATIKVGPFSRGGKSRQGVAACDHDFAPETTLTPLGIFLPAPAETFLLFTESKVTADFMVDALEIVWPSLEERFQVRTLVINLDCGPENNSHRTQFIKRMVEFALNHNITIRLAYYPPYHSKYNSIERVWGVLENHWNGELLDKVEKILGLARTMTYKGIHPVVRLVKGVYKTGVKLTKKAMKVYEDMIERLPGLEKWFVDIPPCPA
ncbi:MAG: ISAzo13 family transposase [Anaerolineae bacterium]